MGQITPQEEKFLLDVVAPFGKLTHNLIINAFLLHPDDGPWRMEYICKALLWHIADQNALAISGNIPVMAVHQGLGALLSNCLYNLGGWTRFYEFVTSFRKETLEQDFIDRFAKGIIAGAILHIAVRDKVR